MIGKRSYRADVQGLRALAVIAVLAFHAGGYLPGGFLGVDIFFVISGFVVGDLLISGRYATIREFWLSRFIRLMPALAVVVLITVLFFIVVLWSDRYLSLPLIGSAGLLSLSNVAIEMTSGDYFDADAGHLPLLHLWSLSVEEQIYFALPALLILIGARTSSRPARLRVVISLLFLIVLSFGLSIFGASELRGQFGFGEALFGFYSPVARLWEFLVGVLVWVALQRTEISSRAQNFLAFIGLGLVMSAVSFWDASLVGADWFNLVAVAGTAMLLSARASILAGSLLALPALRWIGDRSYSIYLWHWPPVVAAKEFWPDSQLAPVIATALSMVPAYYSHRILERDFRRLGDWRSSRFRLALKKSVGLVTVTSLIVLPFTYLSSHDEDFRIASGNALAGDVNDEAWFKYAGTEFQICDHPLTGERGVPDGSYHRCLTTGTDSPTEILLIGDSHAAHFFVGVAELFDAREVTFLGIPPEEYSDPELMHAYQQEFFSEHKPYFVIFSYRWEGYESTPQFARFFGNLTPEEIPSIFAFNGLPTFPMDPVQCKSGYGVFSLFPDCDFPTPDPSLIGDHTSQSRETIEQGILAQLDVIGRGDVLDTYGVICDELLCRMNLGNTVLYADHHHINIDGSRILINEISAELPSSVR